MQEVSGAKASARDATGRAYACSDYVSQSSPLGGLVLENDPVRRRPRESPTKTRAPFWQLFRVEEQLKSGACRKKGGCTHSPPYSGTCGNSNGALLACTYARPGAQT